MWAGVWRLTRTWFIKDHYIFSKFWSKKQLGHEWMKVVTSNKFRHWYVFLFSQKKILRVHLPSLLHCIIITIPDHQITDVSLWSQQLCPPDIHIHLKPCFTSFLLKGMKVRLLKGNDKRQHPLIMSNCPIWLFGVWCGCKKETLPNSPIKQWPWNKCQIKAPGARLICSVFITPFLWRRIWCRIWCIFSLDFHLIYKHIIKGFQNDIKLFSQLLLIKWLQNRT